MAHNLLKSIVLSLFACIAFAACKKGDMQGMFVSYTPINERFEQSMEWNASHSFVEIEIDTDNYTIFSMGDSHVGGTKNLDKYLSDAIAANATAAVMVGDLTIGQVEDYNVFVEHLPNPAPIALFAIVGNHDIYFNGWEQYYSRFGSSTYYFTVKTPEATDLFICLDSGGGTLGDKQIEWFKNILKSIRPQCRRCFLLTHNNFFQPRFTLSTTPLNDELYVLMELITEHAIDFVITAHDHKRNIEIFGNTTYVIMDALVDSYNGASYMKVNVKNGVISYSFVDV